MRAGRGRCERHLGGTGCAGAGEDVEERPRLRHLHGRQRCRGEDQDQEGLLPPWRGEPLIGSVPTYTLATSHSSSSQTNEAAAKVDNVPIAPLSLPSGPGRMLSEHGKAVDCVGGGQSVLGLYQYGHLPLVW